MRKLLEEFKKFINRGNVVDMAVGIIVGSSFTAIVNALSNQILKPLINFILFLIFGENFMTETYTFLRKVEVAQDVLNEAGEVIGTEMVPDLAQSIYIDWGTFINAVLSFLIIAFVLFTIVKAFNKLKEEQQELAKTISKKTLTPAQQKELRKAGVKLRDRKAVVAYLEEKQRLADEAAAAQAAREAEAARLHREANPTTEDLLKAILAEIREKA